MSITTDTSMTAAQFIAKYDRNLIIFKNGIQPKEITVAFTREFIRQSDEVQNAIIAKLSKKALATLNICLAVEAMVYFHNIGKTPNDANYSRLLKKLSYREEPQLAGVVILKCIDVFADNSGEYMKEPMQGYSYIPLGQQKGSESARVFC
jgi:hypothetical protein